MQNIYCLLCIIIIHYLSVILLWHFTIVFLFLLHKMSTLVGICVSALYLTLEFSLTYSSVLRWTFYKGIGSGWLFSLKWELGFSRDFIQYSATCDLLCFACENRVSICFGRSSEKVSSGKQNSITQQ